VLLEKDKKTVQKFEKKSKNRDPELGNPKLVEAKKKFESREKGLEAVKKNFRLAKAAFDGQNQTSSSTHKLK